MRERQFTTVTRAAQHPFRRSSSTRATSHAAPLRVERRPARDIENSVRFIHVALPDGLVAGIKWIYIITRSPESIKM